MTFQEFFEYWRDQPENIGRSFTYWSCLYDYMKQWFEDTEADYMIQDYITCKLGISLKTVQDLPYRAVIEIPDISVYDEIARALYSNDQEDETTY